MKALVVEQGFAAVIKPLNAALPDVRIVGLDFAPSFDDLLASGNGDSDAQNAALRRASNVIGVVRTGPLARSPPGAGFRGRSRAQAIRPARQ